MSFLPHTTTFCISEDSEQLKMITGKLKSASHLLEGTYFLIYLEVAFNNLLPHS